MSFNVKLKHVSN